MIKLTPGEIASKLHVLAQTLPMSLTKKLAPFLRSMLYFWEAFWGIKWWRRAQNESCNIFKLYEIHPRGHGCLNVVQMLSKGGPIVMNMV